MSRFFESTISNQQCGFRKGLSTQQCLLVLLEKWKKSVDSGKAFGAVLTVLSNAFDCLDSEIVIAVRLTHDCLSNRKKKKNKLTVNG